MTSDGWTEHISGRERVRMVMDTLESPSTVNEIATTADVAWETAASELDRLVLDNQVIEREDDRYEPNLKRQFIEQILRLIERNSRDELESQLLEYQTRIEALEAEYEADSATDLRDRMSEENLAADSLTEIRNASDTWGALEYELRLHKHALHLYDDIVRFADSPSGRGVHGMS